MKDGLTPRTLWGPYSLDKSSEAEAGDRGGHSERPNPEVTLGKSLIWLLTVVSLPCGMAAV